jgi:hypothetical protein
MGFWSAGGLVFLGWVLAQLSDLFKTQRDRKHRMQDRDLDRLDKEDEFQRANLRELQKNLGELSVAVGKATRTTGSDADRGEAVHLASEWGRKSHMCASLVSDDSLRASANEMSSRLSDALTGDAAGQWPDTIKAVANLVERIGGRLRERTMLARPDSSITGYVTVAGAKLSKLP